MLVAVLAAIPAIGFLAGALLWPVLSAGLPVLPPVLRFVLTFILFAGGPGLALSAGLLRTFDRLTCGVLTLAIGLAAAPMLAHALGIAGALHLFPHAASGLAGAAIARLLYPVRATRPPAAPLLARALIVTALSLAVGGVAYANRVTVTPDAIVVNGDYDSFDSTYYAAIAAEAAYHVPPSAPFNAGRALNYAYYPHLFLAMVHRFGGVPLLSIYFGYAWVMFLALAAMTLFVLMARVVTPAMAALAAVLFLIGSDLSWIAAWLGPPDTYLWDYVIWASNTQSPAAETLTFNTFTPAMTVLFAALFATAIAGERSASKRWLVLAALLVAALLQYKPFAYADTMAGLAAAVVFAGRRSDTRRRYLIVIGLALLFTIPFAWSILRHYDESQARLTIDLWVMPRMMLDKLALTDNVAAIVTRMGLGGNAAAVAIALIATPIFLALGLGYRCLGLRELWRGLKGQHGGFVGLAAWTALAGGTMPFLIATDPYHQTLHFYQVTLFLMPIFVALALTRLPSRARWIAAAVTIAIAVPSTAHYLRRKWNDAERPFATASGAEQSFATHLGTLDRDTTVVLHDRPDSPSLLMILSGRRSVLAWSRYVPHSRDRAREVAYFFASAGGPPEAALAILEKYRVTHVVEASHHGIHPDVKRSLLIERQEGDMTLYRVRWQTPAPAAGR